MNKIIYLDAAASSLKPESVIVTETDFLRNNYANSGRGVCARAVAVDNMVAKTRERVARFINAQANQIVFTSGATDGLNRVVSLARQMCDKTVPTVAVSDLDHHSARLPWENLAGQGGCNIVSMQLDDDFNIDTNNIPYADIMVITAMSNVLGDAQDVATIIRLAREKNPSVVTIVDASQYVVHLPIDVVAWDADFVVFSGHKIGADTGLGIMFVRAGDELQPDKFGGGMVRIVSDSVIAYGDVPEKFEAGTLPLTQISGLGVAIDYLVAHRPNLNLIKYLYDELENVPRIKILSHRDATVLTFVVHDMHVLDFGAMMGAYNICLRVGNMCASWVHNRLGVTGTIRISVGNWNTPDEIKNVIETIKTIVK